MNRQQAAQKQNSYLYQIEVLVEGEHHSTALEQLIHKLNSCQFSDYRITSGVQLGAIIEEKKAATQTVTPVAVPATAASPAAEPDDAVGYDAIRRFMKSNTLVRFIVNRGFGVTLNIPCRIINMDDSEHLVTVYHVDEKQVYTFRLNEIEDIKN